MKHLHDLLNNSEYRADQKEAIKYAKSKGLLIYQTFSDDILSVEGIQEDEGRLNSYTWQTFGDEKVLVTEIDGSFHITANAANFMNFNVMEDGQLYCKGVIVEPKKREVIELNLERDEMDTLTEHGELTFIKGDILYKIS